MCLEIYALFYFIIVDKVLLALSTSNKGLFFYFGLIIIHIYLLFGIKNERCECLLLYNQASWTVSSKIVFLYCYIEFIRFIFLIKINLYRYKYKTLILYFKISNCNIKVYYDFINMVFLVLVEFYNISILIHISTDVGSAGPSHSVYYGRSLSTRGRWTFLG